MHFLSHFYAELPENQPLFITGLIIPDLAGGFSRAYNSIVKNSVLSTDWKLEQIQQGVHSHYRADKRFHDSELFVQHTGNALQFFLNEGLDRNRLRLSVIAHIAVEMMIDRHIVLENESICTAYYAALKNVEDEVIHNYFDHFSLLAEKRIFLTKFQFFRQREFLYLFKDLENVVFALNRVYGATAKTEFTGEEKSRFLTALNNIETDIRYSWKEMLKG